MNQVSAEQRMWAVIRKLAPVIRLQDVEQLASVSNAEAALYFISLARAGYLKEREPGQWVMAKNTGPKAPERLFAAAFKDAQTHEVRVYDQEPAGALSLMCNVLDPIMEFLDSAEGAITLAQAVAATGLGRRQVLRVLDKLCGEGRLELVQDARQESKAYREFGPAKREPKYRIVKDRPPRPNRQRKKRDTARDKIWRAIRDMRRFTLADLADRCGANFRTVEDYVRMLKAAGCIEIAETAGRKQTLRIVNDPGPQRPVTPEPSRRKKP